MVLKLMMGNKINIFYFKKEKNSAKTKLFFLFFINKNQLNAPPY